MFRNYLNTTTTKQSTAATAASGSQNNNNKDYPPKQEESSARTSFQSNRSSFQSSRLFRFSSINSTTTSSKNTAFYTAESNISTSSFHTAEVPTNSDGNINSNGNSNGNSNSNGNGNSNNAEEAQLPQQTNAANTHLITPDSSPYIEPASIKTTPAPIATNNKHTITEAAAMEFHTNEDADLIHAMARQYVIDAEAAGSASPSQRSRNTTDASSKNNLKIAHSLGGDITSTTSSENLPPQLPPLHLALGSDTYNTNTHQSVGRDNDDTSSEFYPIPSKPQHNIGNAQQEEMERFSDIPVATADTKEEIEGSFGERGYDVEELEDDVNEAKHFVPARIRYPPPKYEMHVDSSIPLGVILFLLGFLLPPLWWAGVLFPRRQDSEVARTWRKYNSLMTLLSLPLLGLFFALGGWHAAHS